MQKALHWHLKPPYKASPGHLRAHHCKAVLGNITENPPTQYYKLGCHYYCMGSQSTHFSPMSKVNNGIPIHYSLVNCIVYTKLDRYPLSEYGTPSALIKL